MDPNPTLCCSHKYGINARVLKIAYVCRRLLFASQQWHFKYKTKQNKSVHACIMLNCSRWVWLRAFATQRLPIPMQFSPYRWSNSFRIYTVHILFFVRACGCYNSFRFLPFFPFLIVCSHSQLLNSLRIKYAFFYASSFESLISSATLCRCELNWELAKKNGNYVYNVYSVCICGRILYFSFKIN